MTELIAFIAGCIISPLVIYYVRRVIETARAYMRAANGGLE